MSSTSVNSSASGDVEHAAPPRRTLASPAWIGSPRTFAGTSSVVRRLAAEGGGQELVTQLVGRITLVSETGRGSALWLLLPLEA
jgi:hypothetical protein